VGFVIIVVVSFFWVGEVYASSLGCQIGIIGVAHGENMQLGSQTFVQCLATIAVKKPRGYR
jgi:hypothetical protein